MSWAELQQSVLRKDAIDPPTFTSVLSEAVKSSLYSTPKRPSSSALSSPSPSRIFESNQELALQLEARRHTNSSSCRPLKLNVVDMPRQVAIECLHSCDDGTYILRKTGQSAHTTVELLARAGGAVRRFIIVLDEAEGEYYVQSISPRASFRTLHELLHFYSVPRPGWDCPILKDFRQGSIRDQPSQHQLALNVAVPQFTF